MEQGIGELLYRLREEAGISQGQLCKGVCSVPQLTRMEQNLLAPDPFQLDYLFRRMGKSTELLEYVLSIEMYEIYELQYLIQTHICRRNLEEAESLLSQYEEKKHAKKTIHMQYILQERAQIAWIRGEGVEEILPVLNQAIKQTMPLEGAVKSGMALGADELRLLLFRWEVCRGTVYARKDEEIREILNYIHHKQIENAELVRVYPYVVLLMGMICDWKKEKDPLLTLTREALSILRNEGRLLFMPDILEQYEKLLETANGDAALIADLKTERESLLTVEEEFQIHLEKYRLFQQWIRSFELDCELVQNTRRASGIVQEDFCEGICSQETLSRIETAKRSPNNRNISGIRSPRFIMNVTKRRKRLRF